MGIVDSESVTTGKSAALRRASNRQWVLKPQDLAMALKLVTLHGNQLSYAELGKRLHLSVFEAHAAVQRLIAARLVVDMGKAHARSWQLCAASS